MYCAVTIFISRLHRNNKKKLPKSLIKSLLIDLKAAHNFSSILLSQFHSNKTQDPTIISNSLCITGCVTVFTSLQKANPS